MGQIARAWYRGWLAVLLLEVVACHQPLAVTSAQRSPAVTMGLQGRVTFAAQARQAQAALTEVGNTAAVSLIDAATGNTVGSSVTDASGSFVLTFSGFTPVTNSPYVLEAIKGLSVGGASNRAGAKAVSIRSLLFYNNGWQSLTNSVPGAGILVSPSTTALCIMASLRNIPTASMSFLVNTLSGSNYSGFSTPPFASFPGDFPGVAALVSNAISLDQDPVGAIGFDGTAATYSLATGVPVITGYSPSIPTPGQNLLLRGAYLDPTAGRNSFWCGSVFAPTSTVSADRTNATVSIPAGAYSAPFYLQQPNGTVQTLSPYLMLHGTVGTFAGYTATGSADGIGNAAAFNQPRGIVFDRAGNAYVADTDNNKIRKISPAGVVTTFAGTGVAGWLDGAGSSAKFYAPRGVAVDPPSGNVYVADDMNDVIRKITPAGVVSTLAGQVQTPAWVDGATTSAQFNRPFSIAYDATSGGLYVADRYNQVIRKVTLGGAVTTLAGSPSVSGHADGTGSAAKFSYLNGVAVDGVGNVYASEDSHYIRKVTPAGVVTTYAGNGTGATVDGATSSAQFNFPHGLAVDGAGNVYVADHYGFRIRVISPSGWVSTAAGTAVGAAANGATSSAQFYYPDGIAFDAFGNLFIADSANARIRTLTP